MTSPTTGSIGISVPVSSLSLSSGTGTGAGVPVPGASITNTITGPVHVPVEAWSIKEHLWLACAVVRNGDQNWMSVSRALKPLVSQVQGQGNQGNQAQGQDQNRPSDWFSHKACAAQYGALLDHVRTPRRKKKLGDNIISTSTSTSNSNNTSSSNNNTSTPTSPADSSSPQDIIMKRLVQERLAELQKLMSDMEHSYMKTKEEIKELKSSSVTEARIKSMYAASEVEKRNKEREAARRAQWLKEREDRRASLERTWRRPDVEPPHPSPLLTSLLQSPTSLGHHPIAVETPSPSSSAPTLSLLLDKTPVPEVTEGVSSIAADVRPLPKSEQQEIEQIKSQLQEIEQRLIGGTMNSDGSVPHSVGLPHLRPNTDSRLSIPKDPDAGKVIEKLDIDDIEIKAEDVYAFSDIDLDIPPVSSIHKGSGRTSNADKNLYNKKESSNSGVGDTSSPSGASNTTGVLDSLLSPPNPDDLCDMADIVTNRNTDSSTPSVVADPKEPPIESNDKPSDTTGSAVVETDKEKTEEVAKEQTANTVAEDSEKVSDQNPPATEEKTEDNKSEDVPEKTEVTVKTEPQDEPEKVAKNQPNQVSPTKNTEKEPQPVVGAESHSESNIETDDDTPIEVIKEDKPGKTKRDYSRKKTEKDGRNTPAEVEDTVIKSEFSDEIGSDNSQGADRKSLSRRFRISGSRSESPATPMDSLPGSPVSTTPPPVKSESSSSNFEQEKLKTWKKSVISIYNRLTSLKFASLFVRPITDEQAPKYSECIKKPMDLSTIKRNIESGVIKKSIEFERDVFLMLTNALMYNRTDHRVYEMAKETMKDTVRELTYLTYIPESEATLSTPIQRARPRPAPRSIGTPKRKRGGGNTPSSSESASKKKKTDDQ